MTTAAAEVGEAEVDIFIFRGLGGGGGGEASSVAGWTSTDLSNVCQKTKSQRGSVATATRACGSLCLLGRQGETENCAARQGRSESEGPSLSLLGRKKETGEVVAREQRDATARRERGVEFFELSLCLFVFFLDVTLRVSFSA